MTKTVASYIGAAIATWMSLLALNLIPDNHYTHWISVAMTGAQIFLTRLGFERTPNGTPIPETVKQFVDNSVERSI